MNRMYLVGVALAAAVAAQAQVTSSVTGRVGTPLTQGATTITGSVDPQAALAGNQSPAADPVLDVSLPKQDFEPGETIVLTTHLHTRAGADVDGDVHVMDTTARNDGHTQMKQHPMVKAQPKGHGRHTVVLDNTPGEHTIAVESDAVVNGNSLHRMTSHYYVVATGKVKVLGVDKVSTTVDGMLVVPVKVVSTEREYVSVQGVLASGNTAVAQAKVGVQLDKGATTVPLTFRLADLVEPGPYRLVNVVAMMGSDLGPELAAAPGTVGQPFNVAGGGHGHEPPPLRNERGEVVGGPYGDPNTPPVDAFAPRPEDDPPQPRQLP